jgi:hypothetical protein
VKLTSFANMAPTKGPALENTGPVDIAELGQRGKFAAPSRHRDGVDGGGHDNFITACDSWTTVQRPAVRCGERRAATKKGPARCETTGPVIGRT